MKFIQAVDTTLERLGIYAAVDPEYIFSVIHCKIRLTAPTNGVMKESHEIDNLQDIPFAAVPRWQENSN